MKNIAENYHDRDICAMVGGCDLVCGCCRKKTTTTIFIEHDSQDHSKDLSICFDCYTSIHKIWKKKTPAKYVLYLIQVINKLKL